MSIDVIEIDERSIEIIKIEDDNINPEDQGYKKISGKALANVSMISGHVAGEIMRHSKDKAVEKVLDGAYKAVIKDGTHLGKSSTLKGAVKGLLFSDDGNALKGHADWIKVDGKEILRSTQLISGVFSAMALASGQYHLSEINKKLDSIDAGINEIYDFLKSDKASSIKADAITLVRISRDIDHILGNGFEKASVSNEIKSIKRNSLHNIEFFKTRISSIRAGLRSNVKVETFKKKMTELEEAYPQYWCSVFNLILSETLDAMISEMDSSEYLTQIYIDLNNEIMFYRASFEKTRKAAQNYINNSKEMNKKRIIPKELVEVINDFPTLGAPGAVVKVAAIGASAVDAKLTEKSEEKRTEAVIQEAGLYNSYSDCIPLDKMVRTIEDYRIARNSEVEILRYKDNYYVKYKEIVSDEDE